MELLRIRVIIQREDEITLATIVAIAAPSTFIFITPHKKKVNNIFITPLIARKNRGCFVSPIERSIEAPKL